MVRRVVFLDQISSFAHLSEDDNNSSKEHEHGEEESESWRKTLVQPVRIPNIEHIHVSISTKKVLAPPSTPPGGQQESQSSSSSSLWYPDGSVALELREQILRQVRLTVKDVNVDFDDVRIRDLQRKKQRRRKKKNNKNKAITTTMTTTMSAHQ